MSQQPFQVQIPAINPIPYIKEAEVDARLRAYLTDPVTNVAVEQRAKVIRQNILEELDRISTELAMFDVVVIKAERKTDVVTTLKPSSVCWVN